MNIRSQLIRISMLAMLLQLTGCAAAVAGGAAGGIFLAKDDNRSIADAAADSEITTRIKTEMIRNKDIRALDIHVSTFNGLVYLEGKVENDREKELAINIAKQTQGVKRVESRIKVSPVIVDEQSRTQKKRR